MRIEGPCLRRHREKFRADDKGEHGKIKPEEKGQKYAVRPEKCRETSYVENKVLKEIFPGVPEDSPEGCRVKKLLFVPYRREEVIQETEHAGDQNKVHERKRCPGYKSTESLCHLYLDKKRKSETEKDQGLNERKAQCKQEFFLLPFEKTLFCRTEDKLKRRPHNGKQTRREQKEKYKAKGPRQPFRERYEVQLLENFFHDDGIVGLRDNTRYVFLHMRRRMGHIDHIADNEKGKKRERNKGQQDIKRYGRDHDVRMVSLVFLENQPRGAGQSPDPGLAFFYYRSNASVHSQR
jgi:hypothetical protein